MIQKTRLFRPSLLAALFGVASAASLLAQGPGGGGHEPHHGPPPNALFDALDTNHDGVISADEITNAPSSLKAMLKNGATELKREDVRPPHPGPMQMAARRVPILKIAPGQSHRRIVPLARPIRLLPQRMPPKPMRRSRDRNGILTTVRRPMRSSMRSMRTTTA